MNYVKSVQTFAEPSPEVLEACINDGVAKVSSFVSEMSAKRLYKNVRPAHELKKTGVLSLTTNKANNGTLPHHAEADAMTWAPELHVVKDLLFTPENEAARIALKFNSIYLEPEEEVKGHLDEVARRGITVIVPTCGGEALFAASPTDDKNQKFVLSEKTLTGEASIMPEFLTSYGPGDVLFVRQAIALCNGEQVGLPQTRHCGAGAENRILFCMDFMIDSIHTGYDLAA